MAKRSPYEAMLRVELERFGVRSFWFEPTRGTHRKVIFALPDGNTRYSVYPNSGSDHRGVLNMRSQFRRQLRELGLSSAPAGGSLDPDEGEGR